MTYISNLKKLEDWYRSQCDGKWEHEYGIEIGNFDNPGWYICIDLKNTRLEAARMKEIIMDNGDDDWMHLEIKDYQFLGRGDPEKLECMIEAFLAFAASEKVRMEKDAT